MQILKWILISLGVLVVIVGAKIVFESGTLRKVDPFFEGRLLKSIPLPGAEDLMVSREDSFLLVSSVDRSPDIEDDELRGDLYYVDLKNDYKITSLSEHLDFPFNPHGISYYKVEDTYHLLVINHAREKESIERFVLKDKQLTYDTTFQDPSLISPNDIVMINESEFYFTNDHKYIKGMRSLLEEYLGRAISNVVYFNGKDFETVAGKIAFANGINYDESRQILFVSSLRKFHVQVFKRNEDGSLDFIEKIKCGTAVDNIEFDENKNIWIGAHPDLLQLDAYMKGKKSMSPSEILKINYTSKGMFTVEKIYLDPGNEMSGSTVAAVMGNYIFAGNVRDDKFLVLERMKP